MHTKLRLLTPGPTPLPEAVRLALAQDMIHHRKAEFVRVMEELQPRLQRLFGTRQPVLPLACSGTGAMVAVATSLFAPGERVLVVEGGKFGERWREIAESLGVQVTVVAVPWGEPVDPAAVAAALEADPSIRGVLVQVSETSTGVLHPVRQLAALTRQRSVLLVADGISAVGVSPCPMDAWGLDALLTGSQKGLMLPPGLALVALSERAWAKAEALGPRHFYFNLLAERDKNRQGQTLFTAPVNLLRGLAVSLALFEEVGMEAVFRKQWALTAMVRHGVRSLGLEPLVREHFTWGLTAVSLPAGVDGAQVLQAAARYGVVLAGGQGHLKGRIVRIGHMGYVDFGDILAGLYALRHGLLDAGGFSACPNYLEIAMKAYEDAMSTGYPWEEEL